MKKNNLEIIIIILLLILIGISALIFVEINRPINIQSVHRREPWGVNDLSRVQGWLTFDYLNFVFRLPPTYLESKLPASDNRYPNISIDHYADRHALGHPQFLVIVKSAIRDYLLQSASSSTNSLMVATST